MSNAESFTNIASAIAQTNAELAVYDSLAERVSAQQETVTALEVAVATLRTNPDGLDAKTRAAKFTAANGALSLSQSDLALAQDALLAQKTKAVATGKATASRLFEVRDLLRIQRTKTISDKLVAEFDWTLVPGFRPQDLANAHQSVRAVAGLGATQLGFELTHTDDYCLVALRRLQEHWDELKPLVEESGLELNIAPIVIPPPAKPKPTVIGNQLGTLAAA